MGLVTYPTPRGALTQLWAGTSPGAASLNGEVNPSSAYPNKFNARYPSTSFHGHGSENLVVMTRSLVENFGLGLKNKLWVSDCSYLLHPPASLSRIFLPTNTFSPTEVRVFSLDLDPYDHVGAPVKLKMTNRLCREDSWPIKELVGW